MEEGELGRFCHCWFSEQSRPQSKTAGSGDESRMKATCVGSRVHQASVGSHIHRLGLGERDQIPIEERCHRLSFSEPH